MRPTSAPVEDPSYTCPSVERLRLSALAATEKRLQLENNERLLAIARRRYLAARGRS